MPFTGCEADTQMPIFILLGWRETREVAIFDCGLSPLRGGVCQGRPEMLEAGASRPVGKPESCFVAELERVEDGGEFGGGEMAPSQNVDSKGVA